jgi:hypothetical protein
MEGYPEARRRPRVTRANSIRGGICCLLLALVAWPCVRTFGGTAAQEELIQVLFGDLADPGGLDANGDGALTVADILLLGPPINPTPTPSPTPSPTPTGILFSGTIAELVPHTVGDQLVYQVTDPLGKITIETTNVLSADAQGGFVVDDQVVSGQQLQSHEEQSYTDTGDQLLFNGFMDLFFMPHTTTTCSPSLLRLVTPLVAEQTFSTTVRCDVRFTDSGVPIGFVNRTDTFTPKDVVDSVTVVAGTYTNVVHISGSTDQSGQLETDEFYIAPGIGAVLQLQSFSGQIYRHELIDGTIGGVPVAR